MHKSFQAFHRMNTIIQFHSQVQHECPELSAAAPDPTHGACRHGESQATRWQPAKFSGRADPALPNGAAVSCLLSPATPTTPSPGGAVRCRDRSCGTQSRPGGGALHTGGPASRDEGGRGSRVSPPPAGAGSRRAVAASRGPRPAQESDENEPVILGCDQAEVVEHRRRPQPVPARDCWNSADMRRASAPYRPSAPYAPYTLVGKCGSAPRASRDGTRCESSRRLLARRYPVPWDLWRPV